MLFIYFVDLITIIYLYDTNIGNFEIVIKITTYETIRILNTNLSFATMRKKILKESK